MELKRIKKENESKDKLIAQLCMEVYSLHETVKESLNKNTEIERLKEENN